jgi:hypothetical protein
VTKEETMADRFARITVSIRKEIRERMLHHKGSTNWSAVCAIAIENEVRTLERAQAVRAQAVVVPLGDIADHIDRAIPLCGQCGKASGPIALGIASAVKCPHCDRLINLGGGD